MNDSSRIEIPHSKTKLSKLLLISIIFLIVGIWMIRKDPHSGNPVFDNPVTKAIGFYGATIMGLFGTYLFTKKLLDKKPALILDSQGIIDNATAFRFGLIPWSDIARIQSATMQTAAPSKQTFITINLLDPQKYIDKEKNPIRRKLLEANEKYYGSPVHISTNSLKTSHADLINLITDYFEKHKSVT